jgi:hypothetical protein
MLEAVFFYKGGDERLARSIHQRFTARFPHAATPLVSLDPSNGDSAFEAVHVR